MTRPGPLALAIATFLVSTLPALAALPPDLDSDTWLNGADNCRFVANVGQEDGGGLGASSPPDAIGDICQCGNVVGTDGRVDSADVAALRAYLADPTGAPLSDDARERCAVFGDLAGCDILQAVVLQRALAVPSLGPLTDAQSAQHCPAALSERIYVASTGALGADGTPATPTRRITDAVARARADRVGGELPAGGGIQIHVAAGTYTGSFFSTPPGTEVLPIVLNVPDLTVRGATVLTRDSAGLPTGAQPGTETILRSDITLFGAQYLVLIGRTTDGAVGDRVRVERFSFDGIAPPQFHSAAVFVDRVTGFAIRDSIVHRTGYGLMTRLSSGTIEGNLLSLNNGNSGAFVTGGSLNQPASVSFRANRVQQNGHGLMAKAIGGVSAPIMMGLNTLAPAPIQTLYDRNLPTDLANLPDTLDVSIVGNEFRQNPQLALRLAATTTEGVTAGCTFPVEYGTNGPSQPLTAYLNADVRENGFLLNQPYYGVGTEPAFPCRNDPRLYRFDVSARFVGNTFTSNGGKGLFTSTRWTVCLGVEPPTAYKYIEGSTYDIKDPLLELYPYHYCNPALDPVTLLPLNNTLRINGVVVPPGQFLGP